MYCIPKFNRSNLLGRVSLVRKKVVLLKNWPRPLLEDLWLTEHKNFKTAPALPQSLSFFGTQVFFAPVLNFFLSQMKFGIQSLKFEVQLDFLNKCSRGLKFDHPKFEVFEFRYFGVCSKTRPGRYYVWLSKDMGVFFVTGYMFKIYCV